MCPNKDEKLLEGSYRWKYHKLDDDKSVNDDYKPIDFYEKVILSNDKIKELGWEDFRNKIGWYNHGNGKLYNFEEAWYFFHKCVLRFAKERHFERNSKGIKMEKSILDVRDSIWWLYKFISNPDNKCFFGSNGLKIDDEIGEIILCFTSRKDDGEVNEVKTMIIDKEPHILEDFSTMLLKLYNLKDTKMIVSSQCRRWYIKLFTFLLPTENSLTWNLFASILPFILLAFLIVFASEHCTTCHSNSIFPLGDKIKLSVANNKVAGQELIVFNTLYLITIVEGLVITLPVIVLIASLFNHSLMKLLVPRLFAGIVIGYFPILIASDFWRFALLADYWAIGAIDGFALILSFVYLYHEIMNIVCCRGKALKRALNIFAKSIVYSFCTGIIILDIFTIYFLPILKITQIKDKYNLHVGIIGAIDLKILLLFFPLALLIGLFVQIIWEDKPITCPIQ